MSRKNDRDLRADFEKQLMSEPGRDPESIKHSISGGYRDNRTALLYVAFKRAYKDSIKFHNKNMINTTGKPKRIIGKCNGKGLYWFSNRPYIHGSLISADTELARLAAESPGVKFSIFCLEKSEVCALPVESTKCEHGTDVQEFVSNIIDSFNVTSLPHEVFHKLTPMDQGISISGLMDLIPIQDSVKSVPFSSFSLTNNRANTMSRLIKMYYDQMNREE